MINSKKPDYGKWRVITLSAVYLLIGLHIAHWKISGRTLAPLEFNEVLYTIHLGIITAGFIFMALAMLSTILVGRFFCSWMCHILALQDASAWLLQKLNIKPKHFRSRILIWIPFVALFYLFVLPQIERIYLGQPSLQYRVLTDKEGWASFVTNDFWRNLPGLGITLLTFFICGFIFIYFLGTRSFCQYACPYGALFSLTDRVAPGKIVLQGDCNQCGICTSVCQSHIKIHQEVLQFNKVVNSNCLKDLDCVQACPTDALKFGFTKPSFFKTLSAGTKKQFDFSYTEDIILGVLFFLFVIIYRGLYDSVPFLLALSVGIILSYLVIVFIRLIHLEFVRSGSFVLKQSGRFTAVGKIFSGLLLVLVAFTIHSGWIHYHQYVGNTFYNKIAWNSKEGGYNKDEKSPLIEKAKYHLELVNDFGIYHPPTLSRELAAIYLLNDEKQIAGVQLKNLLDKLPDDREAQLRYAKILFTTGKENESVEMLKKVVNANAISEHEYIIKSDALLMLGHIEEKNGFTTIASDRYNQALQACKDNEEAVLALGVLYTRTDHLNEAEKYLTRASYLYLNSPLIENNLAVVYMKQHKYAMALSHLENLLLIQPGNIQARYQSAMMKYAMGKKDESKTILRQIVLDNPGYNQARDAYNMIDGISGEKQNSFSSNRIKYSHSLIEK